MYPSPSYHTCDLSLEYYAWLARGCPDRRLHRTAELIDPLMTVSTQLLSGRPQGLSETETEGLRSLSMNLKFLCANLAGSSVPHTLVHGDLGGNMGIFAQPPVKGDEADSGGTCL